MNGFEGIGLIVGHLIGDYIVQNDWMAANKTNGHPGPKPGLVYLPDGSPVTASDEGLGVRLAAYWFAVAKWRKGHLACTVHCLLYTLAVWACSFWWMPAWGLATCFLAHWPVDRFRLAGRWMRNVSGQKAFATGPMAPWSIIIVDNTFHIATLFVIAVVAASQ